MVAILVYPDAAFPYMELYMKTYMEAYMEAYTEGASARMDTALLQVGRAMNTNEWFPPFKSLQN